MANTAPNEYDTNERTDARLLGPEEGLGAKATKFDGERKDAKYAETLARATIEDAQEQARQSLEAIAYEEAVFRTRQAVERKQAILKQQHTGKMHGGTRGAVGLARWGGLAVAGTAWAWQFVCAAISLVGIGLWAAIGELVNGTVIGRAVNWVVGLFGTRLESLIPVDTFALAFWAIATIIALCTFIGFLIWFYITGAHVFDTPLTGLITAGTFALSIMPVSNLFPWIPLWVFYINVRSTAQWLRALKPGGSAVMGGV